MTILSHRRAWLVAIMGLACLLATPLSAAAQVPRPLARATEPARGRLEAEASHLRGRDLVASPREVRHTGKTKRVFPAQLGRHAVFARVPRQGVPAALRRHNLMRVFADQIGHPELVPPAAEISLGSSAKLAMQDVQRELDSGERVMVVEDVGTGFTPLKEFLGEAGDQAAQQTNQAARQAISENVRLSAATLHLLAYQLDANSGNVLVRYTPGKAVEADRVRLIDHDVALGTPHSGQYFRGSIFFPGRPLGFQTPQRSVDELPGPVRELVRSLATASSDEIAEAYRITPAEAELVRTSAKTIEERGLSNATQQFLQTARPLHQPGPAGRRAVEAMGAEEARAATRKPAQGASKTASTRPLGSITDHSLEAVREGPLLAGDGKGHRPEGWLNAQDYRDIAAGVVHVLESYPPAEYFYVAIGRSPTPMMAFLDNLAEHARLGSALGITVPASGLKARGDGDQRSQADAIWKPHLKRFLSDDLLRAVEESGRKLLVIDRATTGASVVTARDLVHDFVQGQGFKLKTKPLALSSREVDVPRINLRDRGEFRWINKYGQWAEWPRYEVGVDDPGGLQRRPEYEQLRTALLERMRRDSTLSSLDRLELPPAIRLGENDR